VRRVSRDLPNSLPSADEVEKAALGCLLAGSAEHQTRLLRDLTPEHFHNPAHREILEAFLSARNAAGPEAAVDETLVISRLHALNRLEACGGPAYFAELLTAWTGGGWSAYFDRLEEMRRRRAGLAVARRLLRAFNDQTEDFAGDVADAVKALSSLASREADFDLKPMKPLVQELIDELEQEMTNPDTPGAVVATGFRHLDREVRVEPGDLVVLAGRPSAGKTALCVNLLENITTARGEDGELPQGKLPAAMFSLETPDRRLTRRLVLSRAGIPVRSRGRDLIGREDLRAFNRAGMEIAESSLLIADRPALSIQALEAVLDWAVPRHGLKVVAVDYLQRMTSTSRGAREKRYLEIGEISRGLKVLALKHRIVVIALAQLGRDCETRRPHKADLRESGDIEQDADHVWLLHRPETYDQSAEPGYAELIVAKQKDGGTPDIPLTFHKELCRFESREPSETGTTPGEQSGESPALRRNRAAA